MSDEKFASTDPNNRMAFIRLLESDAPKEWRSECEIASEVRITGQVELFGGGILIRPLTFELNRDGLLKYALCVAGCENSRLDFSEGEDGGYCFDGSYEEEILAILSVALRCRFFLVARTLRTLDRDIPLVREEMDSSHITPDRRSDPALFSERATARDFGSITSTIDSVVALPPRLHHRFANAARLYAAALREIGVDDQLAYIHLVSAVEVLCEGYDLAPDEDPLASEAAAIREFLEPRNRRAWEELGALIKNRKAKKRFIQFVVEHAKSSACVVDRPTDGGVPRKIYTSDLADALGKIYDARSGFLHAGAIMYMSDRRFGTDGSDYDSTVGQTRGNRKFDPEKKIPTLEFFERVVRSCILEFLRKNVAPKLVPATEA